MTSEETDAAAAWAAVQAKKEVCEAARHAFATVRTRTEVDYAMPEARVFIDAITDFLDAVDEYNARYPRRSFVVDRGIVDGEGAIQ